VHLMSMNSKHGFTFLQLEQAPFDLSDRGVSGRTAPGPLDAYVYTERGIYRPGETVHLAGIVRDRIARAAVSPPMTLRVSGPDGKVLIERQLCRMRQVATRTRSIWPTQHAPATGPLRCMSILRINRLDKLPFRSNRSNRHG
ncbi:hypothetical protein VU07_04420, partial [Desulfobulbus sp. F4]|nr:hypothetical protein [Desulfobulbus sp. F4]